MLPNQDTVPPRPVNTAALGVQASERVRHICDGSVAGLIQPQLYGADSGGGYQSCGYGFRSFACRIVILVPFPRVDAHLIQVAFSYNSSLTNSHLVLNLHEYLPV